MPATLKNGHWNVERIISIGLICAVLLGGQAFASSGPPVKKKKATPSLPAKTAAKAGEVKTIKPAPGGEAIHKSIDTTLRDHPFELDANAKLVCEHTTVTAEPVWRGRDKLTFSFNLRNAGTADLKIKAKGG
mgnify:CR=1 FL=1